MSTPETAAATPEQTAASAADALPAAATAVATTTGAASPSTATTVAPAPLARQPTAKKPVLSARMQRLKSSSDHLADDFNKTIHSSLTRASHNLALTTTLFQQTLTIVQDNGTNVHTATSNFTEVLPFLDALSQNQTFPPIRSS